MLLGEDKTPVMEGQTLESGERKKPRAEQLSRKIMAEKVSVTRGFKLTSYEVR